MKKGFEYLMDRDEQIIDFVHRYKAATDDMLAEKFFGLERRNTNVLRVTRKLTERNLLKRVFFNANDSYLVPTRTTCRMLGMPERTPRPMTEQTLPSALAIAYYCIRNGVQRFRASEWQKLYPYMHRQGLDASRYYGWPDDGVFENDEPENDERYMFRMGVFMVDRGGAAHRIKSKVIKFIKKREDLEFLADQIDNELVQITVLTGLEGQQRIVNRYLGGEQFWGVTVRTALIPELGELLTIK